jgi:aspartate-semialdehyde dehydrogenase
MRDDTVGISQDILDMTIHNIWDIEEISKQVDFIFCALDMPDDAIIELEVAYAKHEVVVVSNNSAQRFVEDVPKIVPEINGIWMYRC